MLGSLAGRKPFELGAPRILERVVRRVRYRDCYRRLAGAPRLVPEQQRLVAELRREGTLVLPGYVKRERLEIMRAETQRDLDHLRFETPCLAQSRIDPRQHADLMENFLLASPHELHARGAAFTRDEAKSLDQVVREFEPSALTTYPLQSSPTFRELWLDPWLLAVIAHYLGLVPKLVEAYVRRNFPARHWTMNHYWHRDLNDPHQLLKMFVFLSDCSVDNGPHEFVRGSHADYSRLNGKRYYTDQELNQVYPPDSPERLVSEVSAGTIIIEDTRGLHRARMPDHGFRDLGYAVFMPLADGAEPALYDFPAGAWDGLSTFQKAFIPAADLKGSDPTLRGRST